MMTLIPQLANRKLAAFRVAARTVVDCILAKPRYGIHNLDRYYEPCRMSIHCFYIQTGHFILHAD